MGRQGKVVRVSDEVHDLLSRKKTEFRSWDALLRCLLGLGPRKGVLPRLREVWLVAGCSRYFEKLSEARGESIKQAVRSGSGKPEVPTKLREVL